MKPVSIDFETGRKIPNAFDEPTGVSLEPKTRKGTKGVHLKKMEAGEMRPSELKLKKPSDQILFPKAPPKESFSYSPPPHTVVPL